jgi:hypothetical protein
MTPSPDRTAHLAWDDSLALAGVSYIERNLGRLDAGGPLSAAALRRIVASVAAELALRRHLDHEGTPYSLIDGEPFSRPAWPRLTIGGRRIHLETQLLSSRPAIARIPLDPSAVHDFPVSLPRKLIESEALSEGDLLAFALLLAHETRTLAGHQRAVASGLPIHLIARPPELSWSQPPTEADLGVVSVAAHRGVADLVLEGVLASHEPWRSSAALDASSSYRTPPLHSLTSLHSRSLPEGPILLSAENRGRSWTLHPGAWHNIWVYGTEIVILGWTTLGEFRRSSTRSPIPHLPPPGSRPPAGSFAAPTSILRPLQALTSHIPQP